MKIKVKITTTENMKYFNCAKDTIKEIELEQYVAAVTASEIGNAPLEACKAQAIAARTFAASRGVLDGKAISDSAAKAQAYRAPRNNYANCNAAAEQTAGMILEYNNSPAAVVYTASNGGRTYSAKEVWGGERPYLIARSDPWDDKGKSGHGVGLSQNGAKNAANKGVGFKEILAFYYPGTTLKEIKMKQEDKIKTDVLVQLKKVVQEAIKKLEEQ